MTQVARLFPKVRDWIGPIAAVMLCFSTATLLAQNLDARGNYRPTVADADPGVDHGNSDASLPQEFQRHLVLYRSLEPPGTIIIDTPSRHLFLIQSPTSALELWHRRRP